MSDSEFRQTAPKFMSDTGLRRFRARQAGGDDLFEYSVERVLLTPVGEVRVQFGEVGYVADVIADTVVGLVRVAQGVSHGGEAVDGLQDRDAVLAAAAEVVHFSASRMPV